MRFPRSSGLLLHVTSLPGGGPPEDLGMGDLGPSAYRFVDFLEEAGQSIWQVLPLTPPAQGNSPYSSYSAFAGNPNLISIVSLFDDGLLQPDAREQLRQATVENHSTRPGCHVDFESVARLKTDWLQKSHAHFLETRPHAHVEAIHEFESANQEWLHDYARFEAFREHFGTANWTEWPAELVSRQPSGLAEWDERLVATIQLTKYIQYLFHRQWHQLKVYANHRGVRLFGDMPIFVAHESADVWAHPSVFQLDENGRSTSVAGVPPDYFSETGQLWGNPLYDWDELERTDYEWWTQRFRVAFDTFDLLRLDHFRGFEAYWKIPAVAETAVDGEWQPGPGLKLFSRVAEKLGELPIVAEDLGLITEEVHELRDAAGFPGMRVLQFGFDDINDNFHRPEAYPVHSVAYTGTHDNDTIIGWFNDREERGVDNSLLAPLLSSESPSPHWQLVQAVIDSDSDTVILPVQDLLGLGNDARMNLPGEAEGNWTWRCCSTALNAELADRLRSLTQDAGRC